MMLGLVSTPSKAILYLDVEVRYLPYIISVNRCMYSIALTT